jgi:hypothetical protein
MNHVRRADRSTCGQVQIGSELRSTAAMFTPARAIEASIHDGSLEAEQRHKANSIVQQVAAIGADGKGAADAAEPELMAKWAQVSDSPPSRRPDQFMSSRKALSKRKGISMARLIPRIREAQIDAFLARNIAKPTFGATFLALAGLSGEILQVSCQRPHPVGSGSIDLWIRLSDRSVILVENKIDAGWSVASGEDQPARYRASAEHLRSQGINAVSLLVAPQRYLMGSRQAEAFDRRISYEACLSHFAGDDRVLLLTAIEQAGSPYEPEPDAPTGDFFLRFRSHAARHFPDLVLKRDPNSAGVRPTGSHTVYFDVGRTLLPQPHLPVPRMSLQAWDSGASSASVKIMLGGLANRSHTIPVPSGLRALGGYIRPAGRSLGLVMDTPRLDTRAPFSSQVGAIEAGLDRAQMLKDWWNAEAGELKVS